MIIFLMENWETLGVAGILLMLGVWYFVHQVNRQNKREDKREERDVKREEKVLDMVDSSLKTIETTTTKNKALNKQIAVIQERTLKVMEKHERESQSVFGKLCETVDNILRNSNGGNPEVVKLRKELEIVKNEIKLDKIS